MEAMDVTGDIQGSLRLHIVDASLNRKGWEYNTSGQIMRKAQQNVASVGRADALVGYDLPQSLEEFDQVLRMHEESNAVLIFAHGSEAPSSDTCGRICVCGESLLPHFLDALDLPLDDKLVMLCCCHGFNEDVRRSILDGRPQGLILIAPACALTRTEARAFFPELVTGLAGLPGDVMPYAAVKYLVQKHCALAHAKMWMYPAA